MNGNRSDNSRKSEENPKKSSHHDRFARASDTFRETAMNPSNEPEDSSANLQTPMGHCLHDAEQFVVIHRIAAPDFTRKPKFYRLVSDGYAFASVKPDELQKRTIRAKLSPNLDGLMPPIPTRQWVKWKPPT